MSRIYDNWERLVGATLRREQLRQLCYADSLSSGSTDFSSRLSDSVSEIEPYDWDNTKIERNLTSEESNEVKQLRPGEIFVNGKLLTRTELVMLLKCPHPPKKLKPGKYWYDKISGLWGKQGQKPSDIISARLRVGGSLESHASNGNSRVHINGREITKVEMRLLKYAGVRCYRGTHLWMTEDGSYQEEGSMYIIGKIWGKVGMKLLCSLLSLPVPPKYSDVYGGLSVPDHIEQRTVHKLLLIGCSGSGTTTIFKQAISLYNDITFLEDELERIKLWIRTNLYGYICILVQGHICSQQEKFKESRKNQSADKHGLKGSAASADAHDESIYPFGPRFEAFFDWLHVTDSLDISSPSFIEAFAPLVEELLRNPAFQATLQCRREINWLLCDDYFLEQAECIFKPDYKPSSTDILYAEGFPSVLSCMDFSFPPPRDDKVHSGNQHESTIRYQLIRSMADGFEYNRKPFEMFEDVQIVIFCISLSDYDQFVIDDNGARVNKMVYYRNCFEKVVKNPIFGQIGFLLLLTKYDLFEEKIKKSPLNQCDWFNDFRPVTSRYCKGVVDNVGEKGFHYISVKFKRLYTALTGRKLYVAKVNCLEQDSVDAALQYAREILRWEEEMLEYLYTDYTTK